MAQMPRLRQRYLQEIAPQMMKEQGYRSIMRVPRLEKIVLNIGLGEAIQNPKALEAASNDLATISGQRPVTTRARKSIAGFKLRQGMAIGLSVTLRNRRMYDFLDRLVNAVLPRIRDFHGVSQDSFDGRGNYSLGIKEQIIFPEINYAKIDKIRGLQVSIVTTARTDEEGRRLLELMGMPFAR
ncbi:MAG: 50S ribosomal protein L5 [Dehalococcoidia bacterium]|nr:50S ribosomal protein L5 [Chloroflexota bacterium]MBT9159449.1 50S ribosomal protein L5 [Chloroflexota bacterium]MBT9161633.1 50S ribosomal protein L5 [Chloroflexota bacterium]